MINQKDIDSQYLGRPCVSCKEFDYKTLTAYIKQAKTALKASANGIAIASNQVLKLDRIPLTSYLHN